MKHGGWWVVFAIGLAGVGQVSAQGAREADSLPVNLRYREREVRVEFRLTAPGYPVVFDISAEDVAVVSSGHDAALPVGSHNLTLPRPRQFSGWSPIPPARMGPCAEAVPSGSGDINGVFGGSYSYTGACGLGGRNSGNRAASLGGGYLPDIPVVVDTFLVVVLPSSWNKQDLQRIGAVADHAEDRADSILKLLGAREEGALGVVIVVR